MAHKRQWVWLILATLVSIPWLVLRLLTLAGVEHPVTVEAHPLLVALFAGIAILCASFLLSWAAEVAQLDISQSLAVAVLALIAVLPEYSVDMYFTWQAGRNPGSEYGHFAIANMTGANRLLIGLAWSLIIFIFYFRTRAFTILIEQGRRLEITFLILATIYSFVIPLKGDIGPIDAVVFVGLFIWYVILAMRSEQVEPDLVGPPVVIAGLPKPTRRALTLVMFLYAAGLILASAEPFSESLVHTGKSLGINSFFLVQWIAPLASEAPEFLIAALFAFRGHSSLALGTLISSKINQWTLLVGLIPFVYSLARGRPDALPMDSVQVHELLLTSAQSVFAVILIVGLRLSLAGGIWLASLFFLQMITQVLFPEHESLRTIFSLAYLAMAVIMLFISKERRQGFRALWHSLRRKEVA